MEVIKTNDYLDILLDLYKEDPKLAKQYHNIAGSNSDTCAHDENKRYLDSDTYTMYVLKDEKKNLAYFGHEVHENKNFLTGFFIRPELRTEEFKQTFWNTIQEKIGYPCYSSLPLNNTRAIRFLMANNFDVVLVTDEYCFLQREG